VLPSERKIHSIYPNDRRKKMTTITVMQRFYDHLRSNPQSKGAYYQTLARLTSLSVDKIRIVTDELGWEFWG